MSEYIESYYRDTLVETSHRAPLTGDVTADVAIVGGGFAGLTTARELARAGRSAVVLEAERVGWAASGRNGGFVSSGYAGTLDPDRLGLDEARALMDLSRQGRDYVREAIAKERMAGVDPVFGWLKVQRYANRAAVDRRAEFSGHLGRPLQVWPRERVRVVLKTPVYHDGLFDPDAFHIHPLNYAVGLAAAVERGGVAIHEASRVVAMERDGAAWRVRTATGSVRAGAVVLCGSAYLGTAHGSLAAAVLPVATYVVVTAPMAEALDEAILFPGAITDTRRAGDYYRRLADGRLLWGGRITTQRSEPRRLSALLQRDILAIYPQLAGLNVTHAWSGLMGYAIHKMPLIGELEEGLWACTAFGGHGLNTTATGGLLVARAIAEGDDSWRRFAPFAVRWGGGPFGRAATQIAYWAMRAGDWLDERRRA